VVNNNIGSTGITDAKAKRTAAANIAQTTKDTNNTKKSTKNTAKRAAANVNAVKPADNSAAVKAQADAARNEAAANNMKIFNMAYNAGRRSGLKKAAEAVKPAAETQTKDIKAYVRDVLNNTGDKTPRKAKPFPNSDGSMGTRTRTRNAASGARTNRATRAAARVNAVTSNIKNNNTNAAASNIMNAVTPQDTAQTNSVPASNPVYDTGMYSAPSSYTAPNNTFIRGADNTPAASNTESAPKSTAQNIKARNINTQNAMNKNGAVNNQNIRNAEEINRQRAMRRNRFSSIFRPYVRRRALKTERIAEGTVTNTVKETPANLVAKKDDGVKNENITTPNDTKNGARNSGQRKGYNDYHYRRWQRSMNPLNRRYNMRFHNALPSRMAKNETIAPAADNAKAPVVTATPAAPVVNEAETSATKVIDAPSVDKNRLDGQVIDKNNLMAEPTETSDSASPATEINTETGDNSADTTTDNNDGGTAETESPAASPEPPEVPAATDNPSSESGE
jgi:hypothetical protein